VLIIVEAYQDYLPIIRQPLSASTTGYRLVRHLPPTPKSRLQITCAYRYVAHHKPVTRLHGPFFSFVILQQQTEISSNRAGRQSRSGAACEMAHAQGRSENVGRLGARQSETSFIFWVACNDRSSHQLRSLVSFQLPPSKWPLLSSHIYSLCLRIRPGNVSINRRKKYWWHIQEERGTEIA